MDRYEIAQGLEPRISKHPHARAIIPPLSSEEYKNEWLGTWTETQGKPVFSIDALMEMKEEIERAQRRTQQTLFIPKGLLSDEDLAGMKVIKSEFLKPNEMLVVPDGALIQPYESIRDFNWKITSEGEDTGAKEA